MVQRSVLDRGEVPPVRNRIELHSVRVRTRHCVTCLAKRALGGLIQSAVEALRLGVGVNDEDFHLGEVDG